MKGKVILFVFVAVVVVAIQTWATGPALALATFDSPILPIGPGGIPEFMLSGTVLSAILAILLSLTLEYVPGAADFWEGYPYKRELLAALGVLLAILLVALHFSGIILLEGFPAEFGWPAIWQLVEAWLSFAGAGQLTYSALEWMRKSS